MTITLTFGWWLLPLAVTIAAFGWHSWATKENRRTGGYEDIGMAMGQLITFSAALVVSLIAWLIWALLT